MLLDLSSELYAWIRGALLISILYHLVFFYKTRHKLYLYYSLFVFCLFVYFIKDITADKWVVFYKYANFVMLLLAIGFYILYTRETLETKIKIPDWDEILALAAKIAFILAIVFIIIQITLGYSYQAKLFLIVMPIVVVFAILTYAVLTKISGSHVKLFIISSFTFIFLSNLSFLLVYALPENYLESRGFEPKFFMYFGALLEAVFTALILAHRAKVVEDKLAVTTDILYERTKENTDLKMTVLQTQMDPHFLYNSLNSINNFVLQNDREKASDYITKFARLIREVLKKSAHLTVSLADDLSVLGLYVKLEQMRTKNGFDYVVTIDESLDIDEIQVPPLFMQPFIENAIWHGFANMPGYHKITLNIIDEEDYIRCEIEDNGIGIGNAQVDPKILKSDKMPFGLKASEDRIKLLHENKNVYVVIEDVSDKESGTKVTIKFPKNLSEN
ncbi:MAG: hypothetical protein CSA39_02540 [Flavobacteriales bacterium]|nr:MAG: hypothetical protein CR989_00420 [Flavobacteriales bacterium]PIE49472.1 MAG: hypothetical protein CSA39_02540 [Flavobacteriales bacterium]